MVTTNHVEPGSCAEKMQTVTVVREGVDPSRKKGNEVLSQHLLHGSSGR